MRTLAGKSRADRADDRALLDEFASALRDLSNLERYSLLQTIYRRIPVPAFYNDLARMVKAGYVRQVFTTNIDSLFEQALESIDLVRDVDFDVIVLGTEQAREALDNLRERDGDNPLLIIKLHGDILEAGVLTTDVSKFLGHRNLSTTTRYLNTTRRLRMALLHVEQARSNADDLANSCKNSPESTPSAGDVPTSPLPDKSLLS